MSSPLGTENKVMSLRDAIGHHVRPGMALHTFGRQAGAALAELARQFNGSKPRFTLITHGVSHISATLVHCGLVHKLIMCSSSEHQPTPGPSAPIQRAFREGRLTIENWSYLTYNLRLMAGAMGLPFLPTRSLVGSTMMEDNRDSAIPFQDPFGGSQPLALVRALNPDLSVIHAWAADKAGNAIFPAYSGETAWGPLASREGVVVTVERIVSEDTVRRYAHLVKVPGYMVRAVAVAPFGAHPGGLDDVGLEGFTPYSEDYDFMSEYRTASKDPATLQQWVDEWILGVPTHRAFLAKLGHPRLASLRERMSPKESDDGSIEGQPSTMVDGLVTPRELMAIVGSREIAERVRTRGYRVVLVGIGAPGLASFIAHRKLRGAGYPVDLVMGGGWLGFTPQLGDPTLGNIGNIRTCTSLADVIMAYNVWVGGVGANSLAVLGTGQIDRVGNMNSTMIPESQTFLVGAGGAHDAVSHANETIAIVLQSTRRLVPRVPYVTSDGRKVRVLVTDLGVFEKGEPEGEFVLTKYLPLPQFTSPNVAADAIRAQCGWDLRVAPSLKRVAPPQAEEIALLRTMDPQGKFTGSHRSVERRS